ncbi:DNA damage tolerance protein RHC31 [Tolypocladium ophioglossoides CBS 100239]|uniref:Ubiquitin-like 1-activating enzyme E1A n=1 Tax=Tolypocladium ophioglossoides (strain CBS 100239) TaxID=1163406 RepID=A0A0L0NDS4_TOLOC|nr:DNA damage tolerance protein RHC31 [Tolypocladium ophioglossoides CBS 100239]
MEQQNQGQNSQHPALPPHLDLDDVVTRANNGDPAPFTMMPEQHFPTAPMPVSDPNIMMPTMMANDGVPAQLQPNSISADDIALYDRQIRLWGMDAQFKIQNSNILLITMRALANEVAKNLVLAGVGSVTLLDGSPVTEADLGAQFLLSDCDDPVGQNRAEAASEGLRKLNPRVRVYVDPESVTAKGPSYFAGYDVIIATDLDPDTFNIINTATRINSKAFYAAGTHGFYGFIFSDLIEHIYVIERDMGNIATEPKQETRTRSIIDVKTRKNGPKTIESVTKRELYSTWFLASDLAVLPHEFTNSRRRLKSVSPVLSCLRALWEFKQLKGGALPSNREDLKLFTQIATQKHKALSLPSETLRPEVLRSFLQNLGSEIAPVTAIIGAQLSQDVINVLSNREQPIQNMVVFDGEKLDAAIYPLHPEGPLGTSLLSLVPNGGDMVMDLGMGGMEGMGGMGGMGMDAGPFGAMPPPDGIPVGGAGLVHGDATVMDGNLGANAQNMPAPEASNSQQANSLSTDQPSSAPEQPTELSERAAAT